MNKHRMHTNMTGGPDRPRQPKEPDFQPNGHLGADRARTPYPNQVKEHRLKITDNPYTHVRGFTCSCGCPISGYSLSDGIGMHDAMLSQRAIRRWEKHTHNQRYDALGPTPETVTIWIEPLNQWRDIPWDAYKFGALAVMTLPKLITLETNQLLLRPTPGNPLIWR